MGKVVKAVAAIAIVAAISYFAPPLGAALGKALLLGAAGTAVATAVVGIGLSIVAGLAIKALSPRAPKPSAEMGAPVILRQSLTDSFILYGRRRTQYLKQVFYHARQSGDDHYRYFVYAIAGHRIAGNPTWLLNDEEVTVDGSGMVTTGPYANAAWLWLQRGLASETANATFVSECGGKWTSAHKGDGIAAIYAKFLMTADVQQSGFATPTAIVDGKDDVYDPRTDAEGYSRNAILCCYDWMRLPREEGGFGAWPDEIPDDDWISAQANVCDETVDSEARYAIDALIVTGAAPAEIRDQFVINMAGSHTCTGGVFEIRPGYYEPVSETLREADLAGPLRVDRFASNEVSANQILGNFVDPGEGYQGMPFTTRTLPGVDTIRQMSIDLAFVTSRKRADRIASIMLNRAGAELSVQWPTNIMGLMVKPLSTVMLDTDRHELSNPAFSVRGWNFTPDFSVNLVLREESADFYDPPTPETVTPPPRIVKPDPIGMPTDAGSVSVTPGGGISATTVAAAITELDNEKAPKASPIFTGVVTTAGQIAFPATVNPSADPNTLDDYEEGAFTPSLRFGGASTGMTYAEQTGRYTKVGRQVTAHTRVRLSAKGSSTGTATLAGFPFTTAAALPGAIAPALAANLTTVTDPMIALANNTAIASLLDSSGGAFAVLTDADFQNSSELYFTITYDAA